MFTSTINKLANSCEIIHGISSISISIKHTGSKFTTSLWVFDKTEFWKLSKYHLSKLPSPHYYKELEINL